jgi:hypothetical protein
VAVTTARGFLGVPLHRERGASRPGKMALSNSRIAGLISQFKSETDGAQNRSEVSWGSGTTSAVHRLMARESIGTALRPCRSTNSLFVNLASVAMIS